ncbi:transglycosylase SLT domain-containing protein [Halomonas piscis]|uniref:transglycosylase SLT domain-containing protein n=1 Tax=Halomonas piscis TaxID=3031727 RepID=UPI00289EF30F|nr:transglycosylase SLT domain-containing protein [Halomonas piscis]
MTYHTLRQRFVLSAGSTLVVSLLMAATVDNASAMPRAPEGNATPPQLPAESSSAAAPAVSDPAPLGLFWEALDARPQDAWTRLRQNLAWDIDRLPPGARARVDKWIARYRQSPENIASITREAKPWLAWITQQVEERGLPGEIALLPFVESSFDPAARSYRGAAGLWQFMPRTGDALGLLRNGRYDGRLDVAASTRAALGYIESQAQRWYGGDIALSLAAYNAGAGTVNKARRRAQRQGRGGDYWSLDLPGETMQYLPKLYAIAEIIGHPDRYGVNLPDINAAPAFATVELNRSMSLANLSRRLDVSASRLARLNPGVLRGTVDPTHGATLLVPSDADRQTLAAFSNAGTSSEQATHRVESGDSLTTIAMRYDVSPNELVRWNAIERSGTLRPGQLLTLSDG